jgi:hypothetical protein
VSFRYERCSFIVWLDMAFTRRCGGFDYIYYGINIAWKRNKGWKIGGFSFVVMMGTGLDTGLLNRSCTLTYRRG